MGGVVILILYVGEHVLYPFMSEILNKHAPEEQRATILSVASFMRMIPYVVLAPIIGYLNTYNQLEYFLISWSALIILSIFLYLAINKRDVRIKLEQNPVLADT